VSGLGIPVSYVGFRVYGTFLGLLLPPSPPRVLAVIVVGVRSARHDFGVRKPLLLLLLVSRAGLRPQQKQPGPGNNPARDVRVGGRWWHGAGTAGPAQHPRVLAGIVKRFTVEGERCGVSSWSLFERFASPRLRRHCRTVHCRGDTHSSAERGSTQYVACIDSCNTQLKAQGPSRTCDESKEEEDVQRCRWKFGNKLPISERGSKRV